MSSITRVNEKRGGIWTPVFVERKKSETLEEGQENIRQKQWGTKEQEREREEADRERETEDEKVKLCCHGNWHGSEEQNKNVNWFTLRECDGATGKK